MECMVAQTQNNIVMENIYHHEELSKDVKNWLSIHRNPNDGSLNEKAYWTIHNINSMLSHTKETELIGYLQTVFNRFKYCY